ncbi:cell division protein FtsL [Metabacillus sp. GX 13764]|uniref:cell division protein FtsL n=1 Tax=Metabacillus kandeliae TaxID=2900151 RepID=UPI001E62754C|nr:cell division protein FtsL [Metabacillus kandeliae]MCD7033898.1 cell division protein FtsL [Metabacillus kandeliae]
MSNLAYKVQQRQQVQKQERQQAVQPQKVVIKRRSAITAGEKLLFILFTAVILISAVKILSNSVAVYKTNVEIQKLQADVDTQAKANSDLQVQVKELSNYDRIYSKAKAMGLTLDKNNVKSVQD